VGKGTGLGLATVYGIVKQSGGFIDVVSGQGKGTTIKINFPQIAKEAQNENEILKLEESFSGSETILLVEDEDIVRRLTRKILSGYGYNILEASYGEDAIRIINEFLDPVHLILSDVVMPQMSGVKMAEKIKEKLPDVKVLFISGYTEETIGRHGKFDSTISFLQKPYTPIELAKMVRKILDQ
jgi:two-component system, cell cycle sensor histidine kinase and response regulator CckA